MKPNNEVVQWVHDMENVFLQIHGEEFSDRVNIKRKLIDAMEATCPHVPNKVIQVFARSRIHMRCKFLNKKNQERALLLKIAKRNAAKRKASNCESLDDSSRAKSKKMKKIVT